MVCNGAGRPVRLHRSEGQCSDFTGADLPPRDLPVARVLIADKGYSRNKVRAMVLEQGITPSIPSRGNRNRRVPYRQ